MNTVEALKQMTPADLAALGLNGIAYVKPVMVEGRVRFAIHAADGTEMGASADRDAAFAAIRQHDLEPLSVH
jgi:hypothetical protein